MSAISWECSCCAASSRPVTGRWRWWAGLPGWSGTQRPLRRAHLLDPTALEVNTAGIRAQLETLFDFDGDNAARLVNNHDWTRDVRLLDFLRDVGKHVTVNQMVAKDSVRSRMDSDQGISFTEFSYMLLQAFDFWWQFEHYDCRLQVGGSDQWGNITAGIDLVRRRSGAAFTG